MVRFMFLKDPSGYSIENQLECSWKNMCLLFPFPAKNVPGEWYSNNVSSYCWIIGGLPNLHWPRDSGRE